MSLLLWVSVMVNCTSWITTRSCGCGVKSYLVLPYGFVLWVRYNQRDEYSVELYVNSALVYGEVVHAITICEARAKASAIATTILGELIGVLGSIPPELDREE